MAILVSGGAGYIGSHTCIELLNAGYDVVVADNYYNASPVVLDRIKQITGKDFRFYKADMTKHEDVEPGHYCCDPVCSLQGRGRECFQAH